MKSRNDRTQLDELILKAAIEALLNFGLCWNLGRRFLPIVERFIESTNNNRIRLFMCSLVQLPGLEGVDVLTRLKPSCSAT